VAQFVLVLVPADGVGAVVVAGVGQVGAGVGEVESLGDVDESSSEFRLPRTANRERIGACAASVGSAPVDVDVVPVLDTRSVLNEPGSQPSRDACCRTWFSCA
jgi:hypothetical protein